MMYNPIDYLVSLGYDRDEAIREFRACQQNIDVTISRLAAAKRQRAEEYTRK